MNNLPRFIKIKKIQKLWLKAFESAMCLIQCCYFVNNKKFVAVLQAEINFRIFEYFVRKLIHTGLLQLKSISNYRQ